MNLPNSLYLKMISQSKQKEESNYLLTESQLVLDFLDEGSTSSTIDLGRALQLPSIIYASYPNSQQIQTRVQPRFSTFELPSTTLRNVDYQTAIPRPVYDSQNQNTKEEEETPSAPSSPTPSAITQNIAIEISVLEKEFQIDKTRLQKNFYSKKNE